MNDKTLMNIDLGMTWEESKEFPGIISAHGPEISEIICPSAEDCLLFHLNEYIEDIRATRKLSKHEKEYVLTDSQEKIYKWAHDFRNKIEKELSENNNKKRF